MTDSYYKFLVIDDDNINNMVCKAAIKAATGGTVATCFTNPILGLAFVKDMPPPPDSQPHHTILFLDLNMPDMSGWDWLEHYNYVPESVRCHITIFILSSSVSPTDIELARSNKFVKEYLTKPLNKAKVAEILDIMTKEKQMNQVA